MDSKLCVNCKWVFDTAGSSVHCADRYLCTHSRSVEAVSLVTGDTKYNSCEYMRHGREEFGYRCGKVGRLWEDLNNS